MEAAASKNIWAAKAAALQSFRSNEFDRALPLILAVAKREPRSENIKNAVVCLRSLARFDEALDLLKTNQDRVEPIFYDDLLCSLYLRLGQIEAAIAHGDAALRIKDAQIPVISVKRPVLHRFDPEQRAANVICFSVWGTDPRYLSGAITNSIVARYLYPGWTARFYADESTPEEFRRALARNGAEVVLVRDLPAQRYGLFWRFLAEDDPAVAIFLVRDADSIMNVKERWAVSDWLKTDAAFHVLRDNPLHSELMLAGMWGAHRGNIGDMRARILQFSESGAKIGNDTTVDQRFLRTSIWPIARHSVTIHDSFFNFMEPRQYSADFALPRGMHIGQNDWIHYVRTG